MMLIFSSCDNYRLSLSLRKMKGQAVELGGLTPFYLGREQSDSVIKPKYARLVAFYDSTVCQACLINQFHEWEDIIAYEKTFKGNFEIMFIFDPPLKKKDWLRYSFAENKFKHLVWFDLDHIFIENNRFIPKDKRLHIFLLDSNNRIVLAGDPLSNQNFKMIFDKTVQNIIENKGEYVDLAGS